MRLEDEIRQEKFESEHQKALLNILVSANWLSNMTNHVLKPFGISAQQYNVLRILKGQYPTPATLGLIQERMLDKMSNASRLVDKLLEKKFVERSQCCDNRRKVDILITQKGLDLLKASEAPVNGTNNALKNINQEEARELSRILEKLRG